MPQNNTPTESKSSDGIKIGRFGRRTWDKEFYKQKMEQNRKRKRNDAPEEEEDDDILENSQIATDAPKEGSDASIPASKKRKTVVKALEARSESISSSVSIGRRKILPTLDEDTNPLLGGLSSDGPKKFTPKSQFFCELCRREFRDNHSLVDHYNSEQHVFNSGMMMRAKKASASDVMQKLAEARKAASGKRKKPASSKTSEIVAQVSAAQKSKQQQYADLVAAKQKELKRKEEERAEREKRKDTIQNVSLHRSKQEKQLQQLLGFGSFGKDK